MRLMKMPRNRRLESKLWVQCFFSHPQTFLHQTFSSSHEFSNISLNFHRIIACIIVFYVEKMKHEIRFESLFTATRACGKTFDKEQQQEDE